jgi:hypothetical protein
MSEWVKCSEQMPESGKSVLLAFKNELDKWRTRIGFYTNGGDISWPAYLCDIEDCYICAGFEDHFLGAGWWQEIDDHGSCDGSYDQLFNVTHWQELPDYPKA